MDAERDANGFGLWDQFITMPSYNSGVANSLQPMNG